MQNSTSLKYEPSLELLLITAKQLFSNRKLYRFLTPVQVLASRAEETTESRHRSLHLSIQGYLAHKKTHPFRTLPWAYAEGPSGVHLLR